MSNRIHSQGGVRGKPRKTARLTETEKTARLIETEAAIEAGRRAAALARQAEDRITLSFPRSDVQEMLINAMAEISQVGMGFYWATRHEFALWSIIQAGGGHYGQMQVYPEDAADILTVAEALNQWPVFNGADLDNPFRFVSLDEWRRLFLESNQ